VFLPFEHVEFDWDDVDTAKCQKHGLSIDDIRGCSPTIRWWFWTMSIQVLKNGCSRWGGGPAGG
jgi:hypothetical protein